MKVYFINNEGTGFADHVEIATGTNIKQFFASQMPEGSEVGSYMVRINRQIATADQVLQEGDRISILPGKIAAA